MHKRSAQDWEEAAKAVWPRSSTALGGSPPKLQRFGAVAPLQAGFFKLGALNLPYAVGVTNDVNTTDSPTQIFQRTATWFNSMIGRTGGGLLLFVSNDLPARIVDEIRGLSGGGVCAGHYDLLTGKDSIAGTLGWRDEILGK
jgi:hypothetical protein